MEGGRERWGKRGKKGERVKVLGALDVAECTSANPKDCRMGWVGKGGGGWGLPRFLDCRLSASSDVPRVVLSAPVRRLIFSPLL